MAEHEYVLKAYWQGGLEGNGRIEVGHLEQEVSVPVELNGPGRGTNPEELLVGAAATCYLITLAAILQKRGIAVESLSLISRGSLSTDGGLKFTRIHHEPTIGLAADADEQKLSAATQAAERAEKACLISNAIRGNVTVTVSPTVLGGGVLRQHPSVGLPDSSLQGRL